MTVHNYLGKFIIEGINYLVRAWKVELCGSDETTWPDRWLHPSAGKRTESSGSPKQALDLLRQPILFGAIRGLNLDNKATALVRK